MSNSILQDNKECYVCGIKNGLHRHHVFYGTANRKKAEQDGCWIWLCPFHHNMSDYGIHFDKNLDNRIKQLMETRWLKVYDKTIEDFIMRYGKSYL